MLFLCLFLKPSGPLILPHYPLTSTVYTSPFSNCFTETIMVYNIGSFPAYLIIYHFLYRLHRAHRHYSGFYPLPSICAPLPLSLSPQPPSLLVTADLFYISMCLHIIPIWLKSCSICLALSGLLHLTSNTQGRSMLLQMRCFSLWVG